MRITFLGGGNMALALIGGLRQQGFGAGDIQAVDVFEAARDKLASTFGIRTTDTLDAAALDCDVLVLAVKPQQMRGALAPAQGKLEGQLVVSIAAGLRIDVLARWLGGHARIVRAMPNTPALIGAGATGLVGAPAVTPADRDAATRILSAVGSVTWLPEEGNIDAVTALSGSGPAYVFYFIEALIEAGIAQGLAPETARALALDTVLGAAKLAVSSPDDVATLRARVTSKGGTTEAALRAMEGENFKALVARALDAAQARSRELGEVLGQD